MISRRSTGKLTFLAAAAALPLGLTGPASAAPINWISNGTTFSGNWGDTAHWNAVPPAVPTASDDAIFNNGQTTPYTVTLDATYPVNKISLQNDKISVDVGTNDLQVGAGGIVIAAAASEAGSVTFTSSAGSDPGSVPAAASSPLTIATGAGSDGALTVTNGVTFSRGGSGNVVVASGSGAKGTFTVSNGASASIAGSSTQWGIGGFAQADISIESGGTLATGGHLYLGYTGAGIVNVTVDDATWTHTHSNRYVNFGSTAVGSNAATINLTVENGGSASTSATNGYLYGGETTADRSMGKDINILVTGEGSSMRSGFHYIGGGRNIPVEGDHDTVVADGATLGVLTVLKTWAAADSNNNEVFGDDGTLTLDDGLVDVKGGTPGAETSDAGQVIIEGRLRGNGVIQRQAGSGADPFSMTVAASGELRPGDLLDNTPAIGALTVTEGNVTFGDDGTYFVDVNALGQSDLLNITGNLDLSSLLDTLTVQGIAGGQTYTIANYSGTLTGEFNSISVPVGYSVDYGTGSNSAITLVVPEPASLAWLGLTGVLLFTRRRCS